MGKTKTETTHLKTGVKRGPKPRNFWQRKFAVRVPFTGVTLQKFGLAESANESDKSKAVLALQEYLLQKINEL